MKHVAVLMGGWSAEREISLRSGKACADALERSGYQVSRIDVDRDVAATLRARKPDVALNVLHGRPGEDGTLQGLLEVLGIPYSHSGVLASALAMKKDIAKSVLKSAGVPVPGGMVAARKEAAKRGFDPDSGSITSRSWRAKGSDRRRRSTCAISTNTTSATSC